MNETTVDRALRSGAAILRDAGIENPAREARLLLSHAIAQPAEALLRTPSARIEPSRFEDLLARRAAHEPMAFILGRQGFWSLEFLVSPATLIPRPDSEAIVEAALALPSPAWVLDLGTGTGCLLLSVLHERPNASGVGVDLVPEAALLARTNAENLGLGSRAMFVCGDWATSLNCRFDLILSNPPYIEASMIQTLMPEVSRHEPRRALHGGADGLDAYRAILRSVPDLLSPAGAAVLELGIGQGPAVASLARTVGFASWFHPDLAGIDRAIVLRRD
jgi:release factor glutamine methyltransferase